MYEVNGLILQKIWWGNQDRAAFLEGEKVPDWVWPYALPCGPLLRIERHYVGKFSEDVIARDSVWWNNWLARTCGKQITVETPWSEMESLARANYQRFGDSAQLDPIWRKTQPPVIQPNRCVAPAIQRGQSAKLYANRALAEKDQAAQRRLAEAALLAYRQAFALCPNAGNVVDDYLNWLGCTRSLEEAEAVMTFMEAQGTADGCPTDHWRKCREWFRSLPKTGEPAQLEPFPIATINH